MTSPGFDDATLERFADLVVGFAANVQRGQIVAVGAELGKEHLARALAASAYRHGARFVDVAYFDMHVKRARIRHAAEETLDFVPSWYGERVLEIGRQRCARIGLTGPAAPGLLDDLDPQRAGRDHLPALKETGAVVNERTTNWTAVPCPTPAWARLVHPQLGEEEALDTLARQVLHVCRMDEDDPIAAWSERIEQLVGVAARVSERRFDALHFEGPGTDLTVGLLPTSRFIAARFETVDGIVHMPNLPTEEIFTAPDPRRCEGVVRATKPLVVGGSIVRGLEVEFRDGAAVRIDADENADVLRAWAARDEGASRLGEVALVDGEGRIGALDTVFFDTLLDENAASHVALGSAYEITVGAEDRANVNRSQIHVDFMIGSDEVGVTGVTPGGERVPVLAGGAWQV
ncbi:MAG TPA: aminopeptidase [Solirubrobacteraceae bacterium]|nr:aminopeptidase [Solirubrobacteraceae bacterium]